MKLTFVVEQLALGGAETVALNLADQAMREGHAVDVVSIKAGGALRHQLPAGATPVVLSCERTGRSLRSLIRYLRSARPDGVVAFMDHVNLVTLAAARLAGVPVRVCVTVHSPYDYTVDLWSWPKRVATKALIRLLYPLADSVVCVSAGVRRSFATVVPRRRRGNMSIIYNPVADGVRVTAEPVVKEPVAGRPFRFIYVGRLAEEKDLGTLLTAFGQVASATNAELWLYGEGPMRPQLEATTAAAGLSDRVHFAGFNRDLRAIYANADCLVLCSRFESFGNVLVEALSFGCTVIATDCPVGPSEILEGGRWGTLVSVGDPASLATAMLDSARGDTPPLSTELAHHLKQFDQAVVFGKYLRAMGFPGLATDHV